MKKYLYITVCPTQAKHSPYDVVNDEDLKKYGYAYSVFAFFDDTEIEGPLTAREVQAHRAFQLKQSQNLDIYNTDYEAKEYPATDLSEDDHTHQTLEEPVRQGLVLSQNSDLLDSFSDLWSISPDKITDKYELFQFETGTMEDIKSSISKLEDALRQKAADSSHFMHLQNANIAMLATCVRNELYRLCSMQIWDSSFSFFFDNFMNGTDPAKLGEMTDAEMKRRFSTGSFAHFITGKENEKQLRKCQAAISKTFEAAKDALFLLNLAEQINLVLSGLIKNFNFEFDGLSKKSASTDKSHIEYLNIEKSAYKKSMQSDMNRTLRKMSNSLTRQAYYVSRLCDTVAITALTLFVSYLGHFIADKLPYSAENYLEGDIFTFGNATSSFSVPESVFLASSEATQMTDTSDSYAKLLLFFIYHPFLLWALLMFLILGRICVGGCTVTSTWIGSRKTTKAAAQKMKEFEFVEALINQIEILDREFRHGDTVENQKRYRALHKMDKNLTFALNVHWPQSIDARLDHEDPDHPIDETKDDRTPTTHASVEEEEEKADQDIAKTAPKDSTPLQMMITDGSMAEEDLINTNANSPLVSISSIPSLHATEMVRVKKSGRHRNDTEEEEDSEAEREPSAGLYPKGHGISEEEDDDVGSETNQI